MGRVVEEGKGEREGEEELGTWHSEEGCCR